MAASAFAASLPPLLPVIASTRRPENTKPAAATNNHSAAPGSAPRLKIRETVRAPRASKKLELAHHPRSFTSTNEVEGMPCTMSMAHTM
jgi:hypothetical protein